MLARISKSWVWPAGWEWGWWLLLIVLYAFLARRWGRGFLRWQPRRPTLPALLGLLVSPSLVEELIFRVGFVPHPAESVGLTAWLFGAAAGWAAFVVQHPLNAWLVRPSTRGTFDHPAFLKLAGGLGFFCTCHYGLCGSLPALVLFHWLAVCVWLFLLGGAARLGLGPDCQAGHPVIP